MNHENEILVGDVRDVLPRLKAAGVVVNCVVTSPPYFQLREYGTDSWEGGTDPECDHMVQSKNKGFNERYFGEGAGVGARKQETEGKRPVKGNTCPKCGAVRKQLWKGGDANCDHKASNARSDHSHDKTLDSRGGQGSSSASAKPQPRTCKKCGAERVDEQIGLEDSVEEYVGVMVEVFRMVRDILADDGTLWLNLGDSYAGGGCGARDPERWPKQSRNDHMPIHQKKRTGLRAKNKCLIPHRVAIAMQDDGWIVRQDIVWEKENAMPESVMGRPACSHEYLFLCAKSPRYFNNFAAIREPQTGNTKSRGKKARLEATPKAAAVNMGTGIRSNHSFQEAISKEDAPADGMRHPRSVWTINSKASKEGHFAMFPPELPKRCILAGSRPGDVVLDPFAGSGTTLIQAQQLGRKWIGIELVPDYAAIIRRLVKTQIGLGL